MLGGQATIESKHICKFVILIKNKKDDIEGLRNYDINMKNKINDQYKNGMVDVTV